MITSRAGPGCPQLLSWHICALSEYLRRDSVITKFGHSAWLSRFSPPLCNFNTRFHRWSRGPVDRGIREDLQAVVCPQSKVTYIGWTISSLVFKNSSKRGFKASLVLCSRVAWHSRLRKSSSVTPSVLCNCLKGTWGMVAISLEVSSSTTLFRSTLSQNYQRTRFVLLHD